MNFQLSLFLYSFLLIIIAAPIFIYTLFSGMSINVSTNEDWIVEHLTMGKITGLVLLQLLPVA